MASNFSLSTLLGSSSANAVSADKNDSYQSDKSSGAGFQQALFEANSSVEPPSPPPAAAKPEASLPFDSGNSSPAKPNDAYASAPPKPAGNVSEKPARAEHSKPAEDGPEQPAKADQAKSKAADGDEKGAKVVDKDGKSEATEKDTVAEAGAKAVDEEKTAKEGEGDAKTADADSTQVLLAQDPTKTDATPSADNSAAVTAVAVSLTQTSLTEEKKTDPEGSSDALQNRSILSTAMDMASLGDKQVKADPEAAAKGDKSAQTNKTMSSLEFKLQVQASQLDQKADVSSPELELASVVATKKDMSSHLGELNALGSSLGVARTPTAPLLSTSIKVPFGQPGWGAEVADKVMWMASQKIQSADISINPPDLGPIEAKVQIQQDQVSVTFSAQHAPVKEALEQSLPKLREMMAQNGVNLGSVDIRDYSQSQQQSGGRPEASVYSGKGEADEAEEDVSVVSKQVVAGRGLVDFYA